MYQPQIPMHNNRNGHSEKFNEYQRTQLPIVENLLLIWLDKNIDDNNIKQFQSIINTIKTFTDENQFILFLNNNINENICLIISDSFVEDILPRIHDKSQINSIYVITKGKHRYEQWSKIQGLFENISSIYQSVQQLIKQCEQNALPISIINMNEDISKKNLNQFDLTFIFSQIIKETTKMIEPKKRYLKRFVRFCREAFDHNDKQLEIINQFKEKYLEQTPIQWFNREYFFYPMLNRAFRTIDVEIIVKTGFFIGDLHRQIKQIHSQQFNSQNIMNKIIVYRGQVISKNIFEQLGKSKRGLLSFNNFFYTTKDRDLALDFICHAQKNSQSIRILFVINIDPSKSTLAFAILNNNNNSKEKEEILFSIHTIFRINDIKSIDENQYLYQVDLSLVSDNDQDLRILMNRIRKETFPTKEGWHRLALFLFRSGQLDKAQQIYQILLEQTTDESEIAGISGQLAVIKSDQGKYKDAIAFYEKTLDIFQDAPPENYSHLASSHNNLGNVYYQTGEYSKALEAYEKALEIQQQTLHGNHPNIGLSYGNIGLTLSKMKKYSDALSFYEAALDIQQQSLPPNHPDLAASYNNIATMYNEMGQYPSALEFYQKALAIRSQLQPPNYSALSASYINVGNVYHSMGEYSKALIYYEGGIKIQQQQTLSQNNLALASSYNKLGSVYVDMGNFMKALSFYEQALEIRQQSLPANHPDLSESYNNIGNVYFNMDEYSKALSSYEKGTQIQQQALPANHPILASSYNNIGAVYDKMGDYPKALSFYERTLDIRTRSLPPNHPDLASSYSNIGVVYDKMGDYTKALAAYEKGIQIQQQSLPPNHPDLASSYNNLGAMYEDMNNYPKAIFFYEKALKIRQQSLPSNHPDLCTSYNNIGVVYHHMKDFAKALSYYEAEIDILQQILDSNHPDLASAYSKMGALYEDMGNLSKARSFYGRAVHIGRHSLPADHPHLQMYKKNLDQVTKKV